MSDGEMDGLEVTDCPRCPALVDARSRIVNGTGPGDADVLFVGEAPGAQEDQQGEPFVGRSGSKLDDVLHEVGLDRGDVRITNCVRCRPPENRDPTAEELGNCREWLDREIDAVDPAVIVTLGKVPSEHLLGRDVAVKKEAGELEEVRIADAPRRVLVCGHPASVFYDRSKEGTLRETLAAAAELAGERADDQSRLGDF
jgi:DNA polymerase